MRESAAPPKKKRLVTSIPGHRDCPNFPDVERLLSGVFVHLIIHVLSFKSVLGKISR